MAPIDIDHPEGFRTLTRQDVWWDNTSFVVVGYNDRGVCIKSLCAPVPRWKLWEARLRCLIGPPTPSSFFTTRGHVGRRHRICAWSLSPLSAPPAPRHSVQLALVFVVRPIFGPERLSQNKSRHDGCNERAFHGTLPWSRINPVEPDQSGPRIPPPLTLSRVHSANTATDIGSSLAATVHS
jgi:hypothetical protein